MLEKEFAEHQRNLRGEIMNKFSGYDSTESYGMTNDDAGFPPYSSEPLPYIEPTPQDETGYVGLDPPLN